MRRNLVSQLSPVILRAGVTAREISRKTSVSIPVVRVTNSSGLAPTLFRYTSDNRSVNGTRPLIRRTSFAKRTSFIVGGARASLPALHAAARSNWSHEKIRAARSDGQDARAP